MPFVSTIERQAYGPIAERHRTPSMHWMGQEMNRYSEVKTDLGSETRGQNYTEPSLGDHHPQTQSLTAHTHGRDVYVAVDGVRQRATHDYNSWRHLPDVERFSVFIEFTPGIWADGGSGPRAKWLFGLLAGGGGEVIGLAYEGNPSYRLYARHGFVTFKGAFVGQGNIDNTGQAKAGVVWTYDDVSGDGQWWLYHSNQNTIHRFSYNVGIWKTSWDPAFPQFHGAFAAEGNPPDPDSTWAGGIQHAHIIPRVCSEREALSFFAQRALYFDGEVH